MKSIIGYILAFILIICTVNASSITENQEIVEVKNIYKNVFIGEELILPSDASVILKDGTIELRNVIWDYKTVNTNIEGQYYANGTVNAYAKPVVCTVYVQKDPIFTIEVIGNQYINMEGNLCFSYKVLTGRKDVTLSKGRFELYNDNVKTWSRDIGIDELKNWFGGKNVLAANSGYPLTFNDSKEIIGCTQKLIVNGIVEGKPVEASATIKLSGSVNTPVLEKSKYDNNNILYNANFRVKVGEGVYWIPVAALGKPTLTLADMKLMERKPEVVKTKIKNLYEFILYMRAWDFKGADSNNKDWFDGNLSWAIEQSPQRAFTANNGECGDHAKLVSYILENDYEEVGQIMYKADITYGMGHVFNYIKYNGKYYVFDFTRYSGEKAYNNALESGIIDDYGYKYDCALSNVHEVDTLGDFVLYYRQHYVENSAPGLYVSYRTDNKPPIHWGWAKIKDRFNVYFEKDYGVKLLFRDPKKYDFQIVNKKTKFPLWEDLK